MKRTVLASSDENTFCPCCGVRASANETVCINCGQPMGGLGVSNQPTEEDVIVGRCPNPDCGALVYENDLYCVYCGTDLVMYPPLTKSGRQTQLLGRRCIGCGEPLQPDYAFCINCGRPVGGQVSAQEQANPDDTAESSPSDDTIRPQLVTLTPAEARSGCHKTIVLDDGRSITVDIPPGMNALTSVDVPGLGYPDDQTDAYGPLRLRFYVRNPPSRAR